MEKIDKRSKEYKAMRKMVEDNAPKTLYAQHPIPLDRLEMLKAEAIPCHYARFHQPVPPGRDKEPVSEFQLKRDGKYRVESLLYHPTAGVIFEAIGKDGAEWDITPTANVIHVRV